MGLFGHDAAAVLDGGLPKWLREGRPVETGDAARRRRRPRSAPDFRADRLRGIGDMMRNVDDRRGLVLDARAAGRFTGTAPEPRPGLPSGHMPGRRNLPFTDLLDADRTLLPPDALRERFAAAGRRRQRGRWSRAAAPASPPAS